MFGLEVRLVVLYVLTLGYDVTAGQVLGMRSVLATGSGRSLAWKWRVSQRHVIMLILFFSTTYYVIASPEGFNAISDALNRF